MTLRDQQRPPTADSQAGCCVIYAGDWRREEYHAQYLGRLGTPDGNGAIMASSSHIMPGLGPWPARPH